MENAILTFVVRKKISDGIVGEQIFKSHIIYQSLKEINGNDHIYSDVTLLGSLGAVLGISAENYYVTLCCNYVALSDTMCYAALANVHHLNIIVSM